MCREWVDICCLSPPPPLSLFSFSLSLSVGVTSGHILELIFYPLLLQCASVHCKNLFKWRAPRGSVLTPPHNPPIMLQRNHWFHRALGPHLLCEAARCNIPAIHHSAVISQRWDLKIECRGVRQVLWDQNVNPVTVVVGLILCFCWGSFSGWLLSQSCCRIKLSQGQCNAVYGKCSYICNTSWVYMEHNIRIRSPN